MTFDIRPATADDSAAVHTVRSAITPHLISSPEQVRWRFHNPPAGERGASFVAELDGRVVGFTRAALEWETSVPGQGFHLTMVLAEARGRGIGTALIDTATKHLVSVGATTIRSFTTDAAGRRRAEKAGYREVSVARHQVLDLSVLPPVPARPDGVELRPYAEFADDPRPIHAIEAAALADEPSDLPFDQVPYATWQQTSWADPILDRELSTVAVSDGAPAAIVGINVSGDGRIGSAFTGTLREFRGRGITKYAKTHVLHRARDLGYTHAFTGNDSTNAPMLAINTWLGYRAHTDEAAYRIDL
ncbi:GNAT family N-acetyltransferase [Murinocardiopsis flavida]|nr:GNAT family N-acetyltransferase [Murinocardiopsis flavida]